MRSCSQRRYTDQRLQEEAGQPLEQECRPLEEAMGQSLGLEGQLLEEAMGKPLEQKSQPLEEVVQPLEAAAEGLPLAKAKVGQPQGQ